MIKDQNIALIDEILSILVKTNSRNKAVDKLLDLRSKAKKQETIKGFKEITVKEAV